MVHESTLDDQIIGLIGAQGTVIHGIPNPMFLPEDPNLKSMYEPMVAARRQFLA